MRRVRILILSLLLPVAAWGEAAVLLLPAIGTPREITFSGRVFTVAPGTSSSVFATNVRRLTAPNWEGVSVEVRFAGQTQSVTSGKDGQFEAVFRKGGPGFELGISTVAAFVKGARPGVAPVEVISDEAPFLVISDFDDTIAVTNVLSAPKMVNASFGQDATTHPPVTGMSALYRCLRTGKTQPPGFAIVSGSPVQYSDRMQQFLARHRFPIAALHLRNFGLDTLSGYKQPAIRRLLQSTTQPVIFFGDSGEKDPEVYAEMRKEFPDRIVAVYIRNVGRADDVKRFENMMLFSSASDVAAHALESGFIADGCFDRMTNVEKK